MKRVAHVKIPYLPISETFIYERITKLRNYEGIILTDRKMQNLMLFPYPKIYHMKNIKDMSRFLKKQQVSLIHSYFGTGGVRMLPYKLQTGIPMVTSFHGVDVSARLRDREYRHALHQLFNKGDLFFTVSHAMKQKLVQLGCPSNKIKVIKTGIDFEKYEFKPKRKPRRGKIKIVSVGRLVPKKGMDVLLRAFAKVHHQYPRTKLTIVGSGKMEGKLKDLCRQLNLTNAVRITGSLPHNQVRKLLRNSHLFVLASRTARNGDQEGIPNAIIEAMASGLPVVSTRHSGIPEIIHHYRTGLLAKQGSAKDLSRKIKFLLKHPDHWKPLSKRAYNLAKRNHDIRKQVRKVEQTYSKLINKHEMENTRSFFS